MAERREVVLVCDYCEGTDLVDTHRLTLDGHTAEAEACEGCWSGVVATFAAFVTKGRPVPTKSRVPSKVEWPDTEWHFTHHALQRMGERKLSPHDVLTALARPEVTRPGRASDQELRVRHGVKVVCIPDRRIIMTVAHVDDDDDALVAPLPDLALAQ